MLYTFYKGGLDIGFIVDLVIPLYDVEPEFVVEILVFVVVMGGTTLDRKNRLRRC